MNKKILGVIMLAVALLFGLQISMESLFTQRLSLMTQTMAETEAEVMRREPEKPRIFAIFGIDQTEGDTGRSDCIMLAALEENTLRLCSIARDTLVTLPTGEETKLGHAYAMGGPELALKTINENFHLQVEDYMSVNFSQMAELVDLTGGVEIQLTEAEWNYLGLPKPYLGKLRLNGQQALQYSRIRSIDSDDVRIGRQRNVVMAMLSNVKELPRTQLPELVVESIKLCRTNLDILTLMSLGKDVLSVGGDMGSASLALPGTAVTAWGGTRKDGVWYYVYDLERAAQEIDSFFFGTADSTV